MKKTWFVFLLLWVVETSASSKGEPDKSQGLEIGHQEELEALKPIRVPALVPGSVRQAGDGDENKKKKLGHLKNTNPNRTLGKMELIRKNHRKQQGQEVDNNPKINSKMSRKKYSKEKEMENERKNKSNKKKNDKGHSAIVKGGNVSKNEGAKMRKSREKLNKKKNERKNKVKTSLTDKNTKTNRKAQNHTNKKNGRKNKVKASLTGKNTKNDRKDQNLTNKKKNKDNKRKKSKSIDKARGKKVGRHGSGKKSQKKDNNKKSVHKKKNKSKWQHERGKNKSGDVKKNKKKSIKKSDKNITNHIKGNQNKSQKSNAKEYSDDEKVQKKKKNIGNKKSGDNKKRTDRNKKHKDGGSAEKKKTKNKPRKANDNKKSSIVLNGKKTFKTKPRKFQYKQASTEQSITMGNLHSINDICNMPEHVHLKANESIIIHSVNDKTEQQCDLHITAPSETTIGFRCASFELDERGCRKEHLGMSSVKKYRLQNKKFCKTNKPEDSVFKTKEIFIKYTRTDTAGQQCSGGFICEVYTSGDPPISNWSSKSLELQNLKRQMGISNTLSKATRTFLWDILSSYLANERNNSASEVSRSTKSTRGSIEASLTEAVDRFVELADYMENSTLNDTNADVISNINTEIINSINNFTTLVSQKCGIDPNFYIGSQSMTKFFERVMNANDRLNIASSKMDDEILKEINDANNEIVKSSDILPPSLPPLDDIITTIPTQCLTIFPDATTEYPPIKTGNNRCYVP